MMSAFHVNTIELLTAGFECRTAGLKQMNPDSPARQIPGEQKTCDSAANDADGAFKTGLRLFVFQIYSHDLTNDLGWGFADGHVRLS
jgi:hypothetical protein